VLKDVKFQLQQREALSPRHKLSTIARLPIPWMDFHPTSSFGKIVRCNLPILTAIHKTKWKIAGFIYNYYMVGVTTISYPGFGVLINILFKEDILHTVSQLATFCIIITLTLQTYHFNLWEIKGNGCIANIIIIYFEFCAR